MRQASGVPGFEFLHLLYIMCTETSETLIGSSLSFLWMPLAFIDTTIFQIKDSEKLEECLEINGSKIRTVQKTYDVWTDTILMAFLSE